VKNNAYFEVSFATQKKRQTGKTGKNKNKNGLLQIHFLFYVFASPDLKILIGRYHRRGAPPPL
jgi:hypothetical protein